MSEDTIVFPCPACGSKYSVGPQHAGKKTTCKKCGAPVTVPTPQVANPTFIGGTRTIRRSDIEAMKGEKDESGVMSAPAMEEAPEVDMKGGASVLRKDETLYGQSVPQETSHGTRVPAQRRAPTTGPAPRQATHGPAHGHAPYGAAQGAPKKKKSPMPMLLGIGGGVVALILVIVIVAASGGGNQQGQGGTTQAGGQGPGSNGAGTQGSSKSQDDLLLADLKTNLNNAAALSAEQLELLYKQAKDKKSNPAFKTVMDDYAAELARKAGTEGGERMARVGLMLDSDGYSTGRPLLRKAAETLVHGRTVSRQRDGRTVNVFEKSALYVEVVTRLGWKPYTRPAAFDEYHVLGITEVNEYEDAYRDIPDKSREVELVAPELIEKLQVIEAKVIAAGSALEKAHKEDGFAKNARAAFLRFLEANKGGKINRKKNQRAFSPEAMKRPDEKVDQVWTYTYWKPFIVFVERPVGGGELDDTFKESLASKSALLQHLNEYFRSNLVDKFNLQRVKPGGPGGKRPDLTWYDNKAQQAEAEGWPLEIVVLKDSATFEQFVEDVNDGRRIPGARAFYSPLNERVMTFDDTENSSPETAWFNESVLIHETFHLLSDHYAAGPMFEEAEMRTRPRYTSILVQEGLTDSVSGFTRQGDGRAAKYDFLTQNHLRLKSWQGFYDQIGKKMLYRIEDMLDCRHYGQCEAKALKRWIELKLPVRSQAHANQIGQFGLGLYYASACQASYFFYTYKEGGKYPYRDKWWEYIAKDYKGETQLKSYADTKAIDEFKKMFGIKTDKDWEALNKKFEDFTVGLKPEDVGRSGSAETAPDDEEGFVMPDSGRGNPFERAAPGHDSGFGFRRQD